MKSLSKTVQTLVAVSLLAFVAGCSTGRVNYQEQSTRTNVEITRGNYKVIKMAAEGTSYGFRFLGIIPFASPSHAAARAKMYASVEGDFKGRSVQTINQLEDRGTVYLILFSIPRLTMTGDIVEFDKEEPNRRAETK